MIERAWKLTPALCAVAAILMALRDGWPMADANLVRLTISLPLFLFWPGYALMRFGAGQRDAAATLTFSLGLSLSVSVILGLFLAAIGRLDPKGWLLALGTVTTAFWLIHLSLKPSGDGSIKARLSGVFLRASGGFVGAAALAVIAVFIARDGAQRQQQFHYTEFWMVPFDTPKHDFVTVGLSNGEGVMTRYEIDLMVGGALVAQLPPFDLPARETRSFKFATNASSGGGKRIEAWLYKNGIHDEIYRKVWVSPSALAEAGSEKG